jgi:hypothetical protein
LAKEQAEYAIDGASTFLKQVVPDEYHAAVEGTCVTYEPDEHRAHCDGNIIVLTPGDSPSTMVHEYGHAIETCVPETHQKIMEFYRERTRDDYVEESLAKLTGHNYEANERTLKDNWPDPYCGKRCNGGSEVLSMGLQFMYSDPVGFAEKDPEYFDFVLGLLMEAR